jgi:DinB superfamily
MRIILLNCMHRKMAQLEDVLSRAIRGMTAEEIAIDPPGKWSAAQILEHLNLTYLATIKNLERCLAAGESGVSGGDRSKKRWSRLLVTRLGYFPPGRESPERVRPRGIPFDQVSREIIVNVARMDEVISQCESRFRSRGAIAEHPILGPLSAAEWRGFHVAHGKHHVRQILRLRKNG